MTYLQRPGQPKRKEVTMIPGVFVGPEVCRAVIDVFGAAKAPVDFKILDKFDFNNMSHRAKLKNNDTIILGSLGRQADSQTAATSSTSKAYANHAPFYKYLDLYAKLVHVHNLPSVASKYKNVDFVIVRAGLEGEYSGVEHEVYPGVFESIKIATRTESQRVLDYAFEHCFLTGRKKVTVVHKANIMKMTDGLFLDVAREVSQQYPSVKYQEMIVDNCNMQLVKDPWNFDVMVMQNLYGSIISAVGAGLVGGPGVCAGVNFGPEFQLFEQGTRNSGFGIAGKNIVNPTAMILSSVNMLRTIGFARFGDLINEAVLNVYREGKFLTSDVGGTSTTTEFVKRINVEIEKLDQRGF